MNLLVTIDENYIEPCKVMLYSFFASNADVQHVAVYLLHSGISDEKLEALRSYCALFGAMFIPIVVDEALFDDAPTSRRYPKEMYYRLLSPLVLPQTLDRILYLDPDMLIINSLTPLWEMHLQDKTFAAASHTGLTEVVNGINNARLNTEHAYFNSGVMLIDLNRARELVHADAVFQCVSEYERELILPDQDVFNILYGIHTMPIDDVLWNYDVRNYSKYVIRSAGKHDINWVMKYTAVLHFCGKNKPWNEEYKNPFGILYRHYLSLTMRTCANNLQ